MANDAPTPLRSRRRRRLIRGLCLGLALGLAWPGRGETWLWTSVVLPALSPLVALGGALAARSASLLTVLALPVVLLAWWIPRVLCAYVCPVGLLQEGVARLRGRPRPAGPKLPAVGVWLALATFAGAALGYPLFLWLDPFAIFNSGLNAWRLPLTATSLLPGLGLPALLVLEFAVPQLWCRRLCPLGATQDLLRRMRRTWARVTRRRETAPAWPRTPDRRLFLAACAGATGAWAAQTVRRQPPPLRPPGSLDEENFTGVCVRCGNCAQVCPSRIIQPDLAGGLSGLLAPRLHFSSDFCRADCHRCHQVCPSGAIARLALPEKRRAIIGPARVDFDTCLMAQGRECNACVLACPYDAISVASGPDGFSSRPHVNLDQCNGCGACEAACPVTPGRSIRVHALAKRSVLPA
jgi:ferredoxin-type protein NapF